MKFTKEGVDQSVDKRKWLLLWHYNKTLPTPCDKNSNACHGHVPHATNVLDVFCSCYSVISAVSKT